jgi:hypothetical protein
MTFLTVPYELVAQSIYTEDGLRGAQDVWATAMSRYEPGWLDAHQGVVGRLFQTEAQPAATELIELAWILRELAAKLTAKSEPTFAAKVRQLLSERDERKYEELKAELRVGAFLVGLVQPLAFEPYVAAGVRPHGATASPDYAIRLPDGDVAVEVSVLYVGALDDRERLVGTVRDVLTARIGKEGAHKIVELRVPVDVPQVAAGEFTGKDLVRRIIQEDSGKVHVPLRGASAEVSWRPMNRVYHGQPEWPEGETMAVVTDAPDGAMSVASSVGFAVHPIMPSEERFIDLVYRSLRATLRRKQAQFPFKTEAYLLVLQMGHHRIPNELVDDLIVRRVWPNSKFAWITAIGQYVPRRSYGRDAPAPQLVIAENPNATIPMTKSLSDLLFGVGPSDATTSDASA